MTFHIKFEPVGRRGEFAEGHSLLDCARQLGVDLVNLCSSAASCGRCIVQVIDGMVSDPAAGEGEFLSSQELAEGYRLACQTIPLGDCKVRVPPESLTAPQRTQVEGAEIPVPPEPLVETYLVRLTPLSLDDPHANAGRLLQALEQQHGIVASEIDFAALRDLSPGPRNEHWQVRVAVRGREVVALLPADARALGLAMDLGTTKIATYLIDLETGQTLASRGLMNPQIAYGEDVIARLASAWREPTGAEKMQGLIVETVNEVAGEMCEQVGCGRASIVEAVVVGNTAMHHLFLRLPVEQLAHAPYVPTIASAMDVKARDLGVKMAPGAYIHMLPNIAGYVGADHVAMLLATRAAQAEGVVLALDIGTNTEVCLAEQGRLTSLSCASGPAFEGAHIKHGMRAANGAIEHLRLTGDQIEYQTVGGAPPAGLCGSGILDALAQLCQAGVVDRNGRMGEHPRVRDATNLREFVLVDSNEAANGQPDITFTQRDVRELQLAKGAIRAGIDVLLETNGLTADDITQVIIAGAFGTYIDVASAMTIGMLPRLPLDRFRQVGNAAGMGAKLALISRGKRAEAQTIARQVRYIELATAPGFAKRFSQAMYLG